MDQIFIVDDEKRMCESLSTLLGGEGYAVQTFQDSREAAEAIRAARVDLVLSDIKMPGMSGLELLQIVKETDNDIPVILMTGFASLDSAVDAVSLGAYDYLMKPVEFADLTIVVRRALEKRHGDRSRRELLDELQKSNTVLQRRVAELNALYEAGKSIGSTVNLSELLDQIVALATDVTEANLGSIMLIDSSNEYMTIEAAIGLDQKIVEETRLPLGESIAGHVAQSGEPLFVDDVEHDNRFQRINKERYSSASLLCVPLKIKNKVIGVINMANKRDNRSFTEDDLRLLSTFASQAAVAVDDANHFEKNRRRLVEFEILHEIARELPAIQSMTEFRSVLIEKLKRVFQIDYSIWFRYEPDNRHLVVDSAHGDSGLPLTESGKIDVSKIDKSQLILDDIEVDENWLDDIGQITRDLTTRIKSRPDLPQSGQATMAIPVRRHGEVSFLFFLGNRSAEPYSADDISLARLVISQASLLFEKEQSLLNATRLLTMGNMISEISHDLRKPLTSIKGGLQIIKQRWPELTEKSDFFGMVMDEIQRMNELVRELVDFSNPNKYQTEKIDLRALVNRAAELVAPELRKAKVGYDSEFEDANWEAIINKNQILEAILNLFQNAIDAMPEGGQLSVHGLIEKPGHKKQNYLALRISDNGVGIKKENLSKIFDRYYTSKETGTGLGLAVVERIISAHSGTLTVKSTEGKGTDFTLYFPYSD